MKQNIQDVLDHKILKRENKILQKSLETKFIEDRIIKTITKELVNLIIKLKKLKG